MKSDDVQILIEGGPVDYYLFAKDGSCEKITMGHDVSLGQQPIVIAPAGSAKALILHENASHLLIGSVVSPAWSPSTTRYGAGTNFWTDTKIERPGLQEISWRVWQGQTLN